MNAWINWTLISYIMLFDKDCFAFLNRIFIIWMDPGQEQKRAPMYRALWNVIKYINLILVCSKTRVVQLTIFQPHWILLWIYTEISRKYTHDCVQYFDILLKHVLQVYFESQIILLPVLFHAASPLGSWNSTVDEWTLDRHQHRFQINGQLGKSDMDFSDELLLLGD